MLTYPMEERGSLPLYEYLCRRIRSDILNGTLPAGTRLPSKRALAEHLHISVITVEGAYSQLEAEGYVYSVSGRGSFVAETDNGQAQRIRELTEKLKPLLEELKALGYTRQSLEALWEGGNDHA